MPTRLLCPQDSPSQNTGVGCHFLLQGIVLTQISPNGRGGWTPLRPLRGLQETRVAQLEHADLSEAEPEGEAGWGTQGEQRLASDCPCGHHRRGPQSGTSGIGGGMFPIWKAGSGTSCSLTTSQDVEPPPAAAPTTRRPQSAAEAAADEATPSQRHPISVWRDRQAGAPRAAPRRRLLPRRR